MKAFSFFSSSGKKKENKQLFVAGHTSDLLHRPLDDNPLAHSPVTCNGSVERKPSREPRLSYKRAFSRSTPRLDEPMCPVDVTLPALPARGTRKLSVFRMPRFAAFRDHSPAVDPACAISTPSRRSLSLGSRKAPTPDFIQAVVSNAIILPPVPPLPCDLPPTVRRERPTTRSVSRRSPSMPRASIAEAQEPTDIARAGGFRRRARSFADRESMVKRKKSMPTLEAMWQDFLREVDLDAEALMPPAHSLHAHNIGLAAGMLVGHSAPPLPNLPLRLPERAPGIVVTPGPFTPPESDHDGLDCPTPKQRVISLSPPDSQQAVQHLSPCLPSEITFPPLSSSGPSKASMDSASTMSKIFLDVSRSSSEISLSLFPLPPSPTITPHTVNYDPKQPGKFINYVSPLLQTLPASLDVSGGESGASPVNYKFPPLLKLVRMKGHSASDSGSTFITEEWSEHSRSSSIEHSELRSPWMDAPLKLQTSPGPSGFHSHGIAFHGGGCGENLENGRSLISSKM